jgi:hypothetical protein
MIIYNIYSLKINLMRKFYRQFLTVLLLIFLSATIGYAQVDVTATGGTLSASYTTLKLAFDAINAGTHSGTITIGISASTTEGTTPATLNSSGAGSASYTSVLINPTVDGVSISGNPVTGFGVIQLNGADNVTIDGDNPNTSGTNRNLSVNNTTTTTVIANSCIRIANSAAVTSSDNNTIKNCILNGNVIGGNLSTITSTTGSSNSSFGIYCGGNGGATVTGAPTAITSVTSNTAPSGTTINNLLIDNNAVSQCARAIVFNGAAATVSTGVTITNNVIGGAGTLTGIPPYTTPSTTVYTKSIWLNGTTALSVTGNTIRNILSYIGTTMTGVELAGAIGTGIINISNNNINGVVNNASSAANGIQLSSAGAAYTISGNTITNIQVVGGASIAGVSISTSAPSGTIEKNNISYIYARSTSGYAARGILLSSGNTVVVRNNFIYDLNAVANNSNTGFSFGVRGISIAGGTGHQIYYNSISLSGSMLTGGTSADVTTCLSITGTGQTGIDVRNNILSNTMTGGNGAMVHTCLQLPSGGTSAMNLTLNNNAYFSTSGSTNYILTTGSTLNTYTAANFNPGSITPATNSRSYTSTLSAAGTNDNASFASSSAAPFTTSTNLHIPVATSTLIESGGVNVSGTTTDIDSEIRQGNAGYAGTGLAPDMGADEFEGTNPTWVALDMGATALVAPAASGCYTSAETVTVTIKNYGTALMDFTVNPTTVNVQVTGAVTQSLSALVNSGTLASGGSTNVNMTATLDMTPAGTYNFSASTSVTGDGNPGNDATAATRTVIASTPTPYLQNFDASTTPPSGWTTTGWTIGTTHANPATGNGLYKNLWSSAPSGQFTLLKLGPILSTDALNFDYRIVNYTSYPATPTPNSPAWGSITIQISTDCGGTFSTLAIIDPTNHISSLSWATMTYPLSVYTGQSAIIRFNALWLAGDYYIDFDNFSIQSPPTCFPPTALATSNYTVNGADLLWTSPDSFFDIFIQSTGLPAPGAGTTPTVNDYNSGYSYTWTGGSSGTTYDWYVRADCNAGGGTGISTWAGPNTFITAFNNPTPCGINIGIPDNQCPNALAIPILVTGAGGTSLGTDVILTGVDVIIDHTWDADLAFAVYSPNGVQVLLASANGGSGDDFGNPLNCPTQVCNFNMCGANGSISLGTAPFIGSYIPLEDFNNFNDGSNPNGYWYFLICDDAAGDVGTVVYIKLTFGTPAGSTTWTGTTSNAWNLCSNWTNGIPAPATDVTIPAGLTNYPTLTAAGACDDIFLGSTAAGTATLMDNGNLTVNGTATVERYYATGAPTYNEWHLISAPISNAQAGIYTGNYLQWFEEGLGLGTWHDIINTTDPINPLQGYALYVPANGMTFNYVGNLNTGIVTIPVSAHGLDPLHWNLLGNPYPSSLDWDLVQPVNISNMWTGAVYYLDQATGAYLSYNAGVGAGSRYLPPEQGFFAAFIAEPNVFTVNNSMRTHTGGSNYYKADFDNLLVLEAAGNNFSDAAYLRFDETAAPEVDHFDAFKLFTSSNPYLPQLYTIGGNNLSINVLPATLMVPAGFKAGVPGEYTISIKEVTGMPNVVLEDVVTGIKTDLLNGSYTFNYNLNDPDSRFIIHFTPLGVSENPTDMVNIYSSHKDVYVNVPLNTTGDIVIYNLMGQEVTRTIIKGTFNKITLEKSNYYVVKVMSNESVVTEKVFVK